MLIEKTESVLKWMRLTVFHLLFSSESKQEGFKINLIKYLPQLIELKHFEGDILKMVETVEFRNVKYQFQERLKQT